MIVFLISLVVCIVLHEFAHLIVAKLCGCGVRVYSVGFGKPYLSYKYRNTEYRITPWLLGGYCDLQDELKVSRSKFAFTNLPYLKKFYISIAGCVVNIISGLIVLLFCNYFWNDSLVYFGCINIMLGITNLLPIAPCIDGGYLVYYPMCLKIWGKKKGTLIFEKSVKISFKIIMILNILCIPWIIANWNKF